MADSLAKLASQQLLLFNAQLESLVKAGLPLSEGMRTVARDLRSGRLRSAVTEVAAELESGRSLDEALEKRRSVFPSLYIQMIRTGLKTGHLETALGFLTSLLTTHNELKEKMQRAAFYPVVLILFCVVLIVFNALFALPRLGMLLESVQIKMPAISGWVLALGNIAVWQWLVAAGAVICTVVLLTSLASTRPGARAWESIQLSIPFYRDYYRYTLLSHFCNSLGILMKAGVDVSEAARVLSDLSPSPKARQASAVFFGQMEQGAGVNESLRKTGFFPETLRVAVAGAAQRGTVGESLTEMGRIYKNLAQHNADIFARGILAPALGVLVFVAILIVVVSVYGPVYMYIRQLIKMMNSFASSG